MKLLSGKCAIGAPFPQQTRRLRLGIVGGGRISQTQSMAARLTDRWDIVAGALSSNSSKAAALGTQWHLDEERCYSDYTMMAKSESMRADGIDAVMITTPNHLHYDAAKAFIKAGIHVICEKPLTNHYSQAEELVALCHDHNVVFAVCYVMSAFPMIRQAREIMKDGTLGTLIKSMQSSCKIGWYPIQALMPPMSNGALILRNQVPQAVLVILARMPRIWHNL